MGAAATTASNIAANALLTSDDVEASALHTEDYTGFQLFWEGEDPGHTVGMKLFRTPCRDVIFVILLLLHQLLLLLFQLLLLFPLLLLLSIFLLLLLLFLLLIILATDCDAGQREISSLVCILYGICNPPLSGSNSTWTPCVADNISPFCSCLDIDYVCA